MNQRVLYVDDETGNLKALKRLFRNEAFEFVTFSSPAEALEKIDSINPAVIISDQCMPEMTGIEFLEKVSKKHPDNARIILTGQADLATVIEALNKGHIFRFIQKPWDDEKLLAQVNSGLDHQASALNLRSIVEVLVDDIMDNEKIHKNMLNFTRAVSDELWQPLMIISGYLRLLETSRNDDELFRKYHTNIESQLETIEQLAVKLKTVAKKISAEKSI